MKKTIDLPAFIQAFEDAGRGNMFSTAALYALYEFLEESYTDYELDVINLALEWNEDTLKDVNAAYSLIDKTAYRHGEMDHAAYNEAVYNALSVKTAAILVGSLDDADCRVIYYAY